MSKQGAAEADADVGGEQKLQLRQLVDHPTLGILRLDYDYPTALGDIDDPRSFSYPVVYRVVPGLTFKMAQSGILSSEVEHEFDEAVRWLAEEKKVCAITGDCGFMMWFQERARSRTKVPVFISVLQQLPTLSSTFCKKNDKVIILTANATTIHTMDPLIAQMTGAILEDQHFVWVGCEDVPHFGYEVENGLAVDVAKAEPGILAKIQQALAATPNVRAILLECTELPHYSDSIRAQTGLPVFDAITNCDFIMYAFLDNERFGLTSGWYMNWDGVPEPYQFGQHLSDEQRAKLVSKPVVSDTAVMSMIAEELRKTHLFEEIEHLGLPISLEEAAHAIAEQVET